MTDHLRGEPPKPLTMRERQVLAAYIVTGHQAKAARYLGIANGTVKNTLHRIYSKTDSRCVVQALWKMGYIDPAAVAV